MPARLNRSAYAHAERLIRDGACVDDNRDAWSEHRPSASDEDEFISRHGFRAYGKWHLGIDEQYGKDSKARYKFPYGDFAKVHRCALLAAESRAGQYGYRDIELAVAHLHGMIEAASVA